MTAVAALRTTLTALFPAPGWAWSMERLHDGAADVNKRYGVIKSAGGAGGDETRRPLLTVDMIGLPNNDADGIFGATQQMIEALRESAGPVAIFEPGEPRPSSGAEGRPIYTVAVQATLIDD